jgi:hypothetical protein
MQNNPAYIELKRIEAARRIARILAQSRNRVFLDSETLLLNIVNPINEKLCNIGEYDFSKIKVDTKKLTQK